MESEKEEFPWQMLEETGDQRKEEILLKKVSAAQSGHPQIFKQI